MNKLMVPCEVGEISDGYHTFNELYEHRIALFIALCAEIQAACSYLQPWRSKLHSDGSCFEGWFVLGLGKEAGEQITYHLPMSEWGNTEFVDTLEKAPEWDGHTPAEVLKRIKMLYNE